MTRDYLFKDFELGDRLQNGRTAAAEAVNELPEAQFVASSDNEIVEHLKFTLVVHPIVLGEENARMNTSEANIDVSGDPNRLIFPEDRGRPFFIPGTEVTILIPYKGTPWLWRCRPSTYTMDYPTGNIVNQNQDGGTLVLTIALPHDAPAGRSKEIYDEKMKSIRAFIEWSTAQVSTYNQSLDQIILGAISQRRQRLKQHEDISAILRIPLQERVDAPSLQRLPLQVRRPPPLPVVPRTGSAPEPGINNSDYALILNVIRHEGRTYETTPATYAKLEEEELRDVMLAHLNGHFEGAATGETFRRTGKTDIRIEDKDRNAFIAECKVWSGSGDIPEAVEQLLSYLTWRDCKSALIVFNKSVKGFSELPEKLRQAIVNHSYFVSEIDTDAPGEFRFMMHSAEDEGRRVTLHVFLFNLYCP